MKIKRIIPLVLLALVSVFLLTSCDEMLKSIYKLDANNNSITVTVAMDTAYYTDYASHPVYGVLTGVGSPVTTSATYDYTYYGYAYYTLSFSNLADGTYYLQTFFDHQGTGQYVYPDPTTNFFTDPAGNSVSSISMPWSGNQNGAAVSVYFY
jgi:hypothetical protein